MASIVYSDFPLFQKITLAHIYETHLLTNKLESFLQQMLPMLNIMLNFYHVFILRDILVISATQRQNGYKWILSVTYIIVYP